MAMMRVPSILNIFRQMPLADGDLAQQVTDGRVWAKKPWATSADCPFGLSLDPEIRMRRVAWHVGFRLQRKPDEIEIGDQVKGGVIAAVGSSDKLTACRNCQTTSQGSGVKPLAA